MIFILMNSENIMMKSILFYVEFNCCTDTVHWSCCSFLAYHVKSVPFVWCCMWVVFSMQFWRLWSRSASNHEWTNNWFWRWREWLPHAQCSQSEWQRCHVLSLWCMDRSLLKVHCLLTAFLSLLLLLFFHSVFIGYYFVIY